MHHGITFRGKHSDEFNTIVKTVGRPIIPPVRQVDEEVPYRDGNVDCSETGGRLFYEDKVLELEFTLIAPNTTELQKRVSRFANWLSGGYGELIFDDMPYVKWIAKPADLEDLTINLYKNGKSKVQFRCRPFNRFIFDSNGIPLGSDILLGSDVPIGFGDENEIEFSGNYSGVLDYQGSAPVRPSVNIDLEQGVTSFKLTVNNAEINIAVGDARTFVIDCENGYMPEGVSGNFCELLPGENNISIECSGKGTVFFDYNHNFMFGDDII